MCVCLCTETYVCVCLRAHVCVCLWSRVISPPWPTLHWGCSTSLFFRALLIKVQFCTGMCVCPSLLVWFRLSGPRYTESDNLSEVFCFGSDSVLSIVSPSAPNVCMCRICVCDYLHWPSHGLCGWPCSYARHTHPFDRGPAVILLLVLR